MYRLVLNCCSPLSYLQWELDERPILGVGWSPWPLAVRQRFVRAVVLAEDAALPNIMETRLGVRLLGRDAHMSPLERYHDNGAIRLAPLWPSSLACTFFGR